MQYVGQANSHRLNNKKYRFHGYIGRFNDHLSEGITNTRKVGGCRYLNNAIRKYGNDNFEIELIMNCNLNESDEMEQKFIKIYNSLSPYGYNLTIGGKSTSGWVSPNISIDDTGENIPIKRGRGFGFKHTSETKQKMIAYFDTMDDDIIKKRENTMRDNMTNYYKEKRAQNLANLDIVFDDDFKKYIRPKKKDGKIINYNIRIKREKRGCIENKDLTLEERYKLLYDALEEAYKIQQQRIKSLD